MRGASSGFTLLEVMVSLAIMAGVILTLLGSVNYHIGIIANERDSTTPGAAGQIPYDGTGTGSCKRGGDVCTLPPGTELESGSASSRYTGAAEADSQGTAWQ